MNCKLSSIFEIFRIAFDNFIVFELMFYRYKAKQENKALSEALDKLQERLADETEKSEDKLKNLHKKIKGLEADLKVVTEKFDVASELNGDLGMINVQYFSIEFENNDETT